MGKKPLILLLSPVLTALCLPGWNLISAQEHTHNADWVIIRTSSCTQKGVAEKICKDCGALLETKQLPKTAHVYEWQSLKQVRCWEDGIDVMKCVNCGAEKRKERRIQKTPGHILDNCACVNCNATFDVDDEKHQLVLCDYMLDDIGLSLTGDVTIPEKVSYKGKEYQVIGIGRCLCYQNKDLTSVTLPDTIKVIRAHAFDFCENLESCNLPEGLLEIGDAAFQCCQKLQHIQLPDSLQIIGNFAFNHCSGADNQTIKIPAAIQRMGKFAVAPAHMFYDCGTDAFTAFEKENGGTYMVSDGILYAGQKETLVAIPRGKTFPNNTYCMPDTVKNLGELSFSRNKNIHKVIISDQLLLNKEPTVAQWQSYNNIGNPLSVACYVYADVYAYEAKETNPNYCSENGVLYSKDKKTLVAIPNKYQGELLIPEGVTAWEKESLWTDIDDFKDLAFHTITKIQIPASMQQIEEEQVEAINKLVTLYGTTVVVENGNQWYETDGSGCLQQRTG